MAKFMDKDPFSYEQERSTFVNQLRQFHASKGTPFYRLPTIAGKELDLYLLYSKVVAWGGLTKVTDQGKWENLQECFGIPVTCGHAAFALRQFYVKYLEAYERIHHQGEDAEEVLRSLSRPATPSNQPQKRNIDMRKGLEIPEQLRINAGLSTQKPRLSDYDKIMFSLQSGLPNEVDFAVNVCTLLSNEGRHVLHLERAVKLIDLLLAHCGVFYEGPGGFRSLYTEDWRVTTKRDFVTFWYDTVSDNDIREIIGPDTLRTKDHCKLKDSEQFTVRKLGLNDVEGQRILQVAVILRNLSFEGHNKKVMAAHRTFYRFLLLCIHNSCSALRQIGMDTLSNIAEEFILDPIDYRSTQLMFHTIDKAMKNQDKFIILRAMEVVEKLSQLENNIDIIRQCMEERVYHSIIRLLTIHDVQLLLGALEVLLALSERGEVFCARIASMERSVDVLVCLVTLDAQSLGAEAFVGIKIVDHAPDGIHHPIVTMARQQPVSRATPPPPPANAVASVTPPPQRTVQQQSTPTPPPAPVQPVHRDIDNEKFTCQWLHSFYEADTEGLVSRLDLYSDYLSACSKASRVNMVTSTNFATCIKTVFPGVGFQRVETESGPQVYITGIHKRILPLPFNWLMYQQMSKPSPNYQSQMGGPQSNLASSIMQRMAQRLSPSPGSSSSGTPQHRLFTQGMSSPGSGVMPPQMYRAGMIPGPSVVNNGSSTQLQQLILGHGLRQQNPAAATVSQGQTVNQVNSGTMPVHQVTQQKQVNVPLDVQQQVPPAKPVPSNCPASTGQGTQQQQTTNSNDDTDMLSPQGSLVNQAGIPSAFLQNPLPQHSQTIANNDPSKSPGRSPASPVRAPPPYRPRSPAGSGTKSSVPSPSVPSSGLSSSPSSTCSSTTMPSAPTNALNEGLQEGEVKIEKIPNIHAQLPIDTNQVPVTFPKEGSENFPANSIPLLQTKTASTEQNPDSCQTNQANPQDAAMDVSNAQLSGNTPVRTDAQQVINIPKQMFITPQQLQNPNGIAINPQGIQISAQGIQINPQGVNHSQQQQQQQQMVQGAKNISMQMPATQVGVQQWIQTQPQGGQPNTQGIVNINGQGIVTNGFKGQPNVQIVQQGVLSGTHGIQLGTLPMQTNSLPVQSNYHIQQSDGQGMPQILAKTTPGPHQPQQLIATSSAASTTNSGNQIYSAYAVVQNVQRSVPTVLGQVTSSNPGQTAHGTTPSGAQQTSSTSGPYVPIQPKLPPSIQPQQQQQHAVVQQHQIIQQQQMVQKQQPQQQFILTSIKTSLPQQSFAVPSSTNTQHQPQQQSNFTMSVGTPVTLNSSMQPILTVCPQNTAAGTVAVNRVPTQGQQIASTHIDSPLIKQLLQSGSSVHPPGSNHQPQPQMMNPNMQSAVQWVVPQNPNGNAMHGIVNIQQGVPQAYAVNPNMSQVGNSTTQQPTMHFIPPLCSSPSPAQSPALSCASSSSPSSTSKSGPLSPSPSPQHKSEKKSKSKSHKSKKSSKKKKSKSGSRSPSSTCSKEHGKDASKRKEKDKSNRLIENAVSEDPTNQAKGDQDEKSKICNNSDSKELQSQMLINNVEVSKDLHGTPEPTCNGSSNKEGDETPKTNDIQKLKSKLEEASLKQALLNGYGNGDELDKKHNDVLIHRAELYLENSGKDLDKVMKSPRSRRKSEELGHKERTLRLSMDLDTDMDSSEKQCSNHIMNGDIPEGEDGLSHHDKDVSITVSDNHNLDGEPDKRINSHDNQSSIQPDRENIRLAVNQTDNVDQKDCKKDRDSESDSGIVLNERTGFMHDVTGAIIPAAANSDPNKLANQISFCRDIREHLPSNLSTPESNLNNNSNPHLPEASNNGITATCIPHDNKVCPSIPKPNIQSDLVKGTTNSSAADNNCSTPATTSSISEQTSCSNTKDVLQSQPPLSTTSETKSEKSSKSSSKKSGKRSRHSSDSSSKKRRRSSSSSSSSHHRKSSTSSSSEKSKHHHHHHHQQPQQQVQQQQTQKQVPEPDPCVCDWMGCKRQFKTRKSLHVHASKVHVMVAGYRGMCEWENCDNIQRQRWSCVSHMLEKHCTEQALQAAAEKRKQTAAAASTAGPAAATASTVSGPLPTPILYNAHTAYHAIRRSLHSPSLKDLLGETEGPVTKSIRITAALVLKNLATYSADARSSLRRHEIHLARLAISNAEASSTLAKCIGELNDERHMECDSDDESNS